MSGCIHSSLLAVWERASGEGTQPPLRFLFFILQLQTVLLVHERSTDGQKYFIEHFLF